MTAREAARAIFEAALAAGDAEPLIGRALRVDGPKLVAGPRAVDLGRLRRLLVLGCGKASGAMARAVEGVLGDRIADGFVIVKDGHTAPTRRIRLAQAGHPVPDGRGQVAAARLLELARTAGAGDLVMFLISGGGSALTPAPAPPVTLEEKQAVTRLLLAAGATINELNAVRKHLSLLKGGQLARAAAPAMVLTLILSDVIGDPLDVIASGPTAPDPTTFADALGVLTRRGVRDRAPVSVLARLEAGARGEVEETPKPGDPLFERVTNLVIGNNALTVDAAAAEARRLGFDPHVLTRALEGEAREVARDLLARARRLRPPACLIAGGETTVTVRGRGRGGRCQEFALTAAQELRPHESLVALAAGTDGTDGPTDAAGALVDAGTVARGQAAGHDPRESLKDNDAYAFLRASGDLVITGPTNTNLLDLYIILQPGCPRDERSAPSG
ncbi:MAG TPA: glycerate kinase [Methylomirabilota bacterium]|nr:glycerate kinase [Methylomirabilota bacterium]